MEKGFTINLKQGIDQAHQSFWVPLTLPSNASFLPRSPTFPMPKRTNPMALKIPVPKPNPLFLGNPWLKFTKSNPRTNQLVTNLFFPFRAKEGKTKFASHPSYHQQYST